MPDQDITQQLLARHGQGAPAAPAFQMPEEIAGLLQNATTAQPESKNIAEAMAMMSRYGYDGLRDALTRGGVGNYDANFAEVLPPAMEGYLQSGDEDAETKAKIFLSLLQGF